MDNSKIILTGRCTCCGSTDVYFIENNKKIICKQCNNWAWTEEALQSSWINSIDLPEMRDASKDTGVNIIKKYHLSPKEKCSFCGGIKRFGICQDCGTDM